MRGRSIAYPPPIIRKQKFCYFSLQVIGYSLWSFISFTNPPLCLKEDPLPQPPKNFLKVCSYRYCSFWLLILGHLPIQGSRNVSTPANFPIWLSGAAAVIRGEGSLLSMCKALTGPLAEEGGGGPRVTAAQSPRSGWRVPVKNRYPLPPKGGKCGTGGGGGTGGDKRSFHFWVEL